MGGAEETTVKTSPRTVAETVARLRELAQARGLHVFGVVDHAAAAAGAGLTLRETQVVLLGRPSAGTPVMEAVPLAALDLPLKVLVWADGPVTKVAHTRPAALAARWEIPAGAAAGIAGIDALTDALVAP